MSIADVRPDLVPPDLDKLCEELAGAYEEYTSKVSPDNMAVSIKTAAYFLFLLRALDAVRPADFGSGFSSYVLGKYASEHGQYVDATSVDDSAEWLERTGEFLSSAHLYTELMSWSHYKNTHHHHDVVLYDLGNGQLREIGMEMVARRTVSGGVVLFDDVQHESHRAQMQDVATKVRSKLYFLHEYTSDQYGRFAALLVKR